MLQEIPVDDIFYKQAQGTAHRRLHYYTLRHSIISALERRAAWISYSTESHFQSWLRQFDAIQRPVILKAMEQYRHYSAASMLRLASSRIKDVKWLKELESTETTASTSLWISYLGRVNKSGPATVGMVAKALDALSRKRHNGTGIRLNERIKAYTYHELLQKLEKWSKISPDIKQRKRLMLILVDDFVGSGGQITNNLRKLFSKRLFESVDLSGLFIEVWFALGLDTPSLREFVKCDTNHLESKRNYLIDVEAALNGPEAGWLRLNKPVESDEQAENSRCQGFLNLSITLRIEEVVPQIDFKDIELRSVLKSRAFIAGGREFELPCQFEPFGWKGEGGGGSLISTFANVPGNTLPIIWASGDHREWIPLKDRFFNPFDAGQMEDRPPCLTGSEKGVCPLNVNKLLGRRISKVPQTETLDLRDRYDLRGQDHLLNRAFDIFRREVYSGLACRCVDTRQSVSPNE